MVRRMTALALLPLVAALFLLAGCDEGEQGRVLRYQKGTYLGKQDNKLDQDTLDALRQRASRQEGS